MVLLAQTAPVIAADGPGALPGQGRRAERQCGCEGKAVAMEFSVLNIPFSFIAEWRP